MGFVPHPTCLSDFTDWRIVQSNLTDYALIHPSINHSRKHIVALSYLRAISVKPNNTARCVLHKLTSDAAHMKVFLTIPALSMFHPIITYQFYNNFPIHCMFWVHSGVFPLNITDFFQHKRLWSLPATIPLKESNGLFMFGMLPLTDCRATSFWWFQISHAYLKTMEQFS